MSNTQKFVLVLVVVMLLGIGTGSIILFNTISDDLLHLGDKVVPVDTSINHPLDGVENINISTVAADIDLIPGNNNEVKAVLSGSTPLNENNQPAVKLESEMSGSSLNIEVREFLSINAPKPQLSLQVYIPEEFSNKLDLYSTSGDISVQELKINKLNVDLISGNFTADSIISDKSTFKTTSGDVEISAVSGGLEFETVSGRIESSFTVLDGDININTVSGHAIINLPADADFILEAESTSGSLNSDFPVTVANDPGHAAMYGTIGTGANRISARTISGNVAIGSI